MFALPKLVLIVLLILAVWWVRRWLRNLARELPRRHAPRREAPQQARGPVRPERRVEAVDLAQCGVCGAYVAASAAACGRPDCPRPR
jgi:heme A synthase